MKKLLILLSIVTASVAYSDVSTTLDVNATLVKPLTLETSAKDLVGSVAIIGGDPRFSTVDLLVTGESGKNVIVRAPKDITLTGTKGETQKIVLASKFSTPEISTGTETTTELTIDSISGKAKTTYTLTGTVSENFNGITKSDFVGNINITVAYN